MTPIRGALLDSSSTADIFDRLATLGTDFARAFDAVAGPSHLIETQERDELLEALHDLITTAPADPSLDREQAALAVLRAVNLERTW